MKKFLLQNILNLKIDRYYLIADQELSTHTIFILLIDTSTLKFYISFQIGFYYNKRNN